MYFRLLNLPTELIDLIVEHVYLEGCQLIRAIIPLSLTCKALRAAAKPHLFTTLTIENNGHYLNTERAPRWLHDDKAQSLMNIMPHIIESVSTLKFVSWRRRAHASYNTDTWKFLEDLNMSGAMPRLRTIVFDPPHAYTRSIMRIVAHTDLHIDFEYRNHDSPSPVVMFDPTEHSSSTWSVTSSNGHYGAIDVARKVCDRLKAFQWAYPTNQLTRINHIQLLDDLRSAPLLEELHVSERLLDLNELYARSMSYASQVCGLISNLPLLRRCRIEGNNLTKEFLAILPDLVLLQDLSIYSVYRRVFHPTCDLEDAERAEPESTTDMPWLRLPKLRKLDIRFVCKHFALHQLVPRGLTALRIEFYGGEERATLEDLDWLVQHCPNLERLELDMGSVVESNFQPGPPEDSATASSRLLDMFRKLQGFRQLRTLRLFPSYWYRGKLLSHPFANSAGVASAVKIFSLLRSICSNLHTLIICISFGEYPFDVVPRMSLTTRPAKFVLKNVGGCDGVLVHWGYGGNNEIYEVAYDGDTALPGFKTIPVSPKNFFDDLNSDWILPHYELDR